MATQHTPMFPIVLCIGACVGFLYTIFFLPPYASKNVLDSLHIIILFLLGGLFLLSGFFLCMRKLHRSAAFVRAFLFTAMTLILLWLRIQKIFPLFLCLLLEICGTFSIIEKSANRRKVA